MEQQNLSRAPEESLARCAKDGRYLDTFYRLFFQNRPLLQRKFAGVDMAEQKRKLAQTLPQFLRLPLLSADSPEVTQAVEKHRHAHRGGGSSATYDLWIDTVCQTFRQHDALYSDTVDRELRERLAMAVEIVRGKATPER